MNIRIQNIFEWAITIGIWMIGLGLFIPIAFIIILGSFLTNSRSFDKFIKACARLILRCMFVRVQIEELEKFDHQKVFIFIANHVNILDILILFGHIPNYVRGVELDKHFSWPLYGLVLRRMGHIPISHQNPRRAMQSITAAQNAINSGTSIIILPEGGRTLDGHFKPFKRGSFLLAKQAMVDIIPTVMINAFQVMRKGSLKIRPGKIVLRFGKIISYHSIQELEIDEIKTLVHSEMTRLFNQ
ncbi:1-acyl-sn-glycerol-3-phosphate acyltransferase [candidate division KSB1 bacterium]|nr:1-acyl-sn-glycerol-3-phosphate acyltransferase [candidate division KSB1 bacterium]